MTSGAFDVVIESIGTAVPEFKYTQEEALERSKLLMPHFSNMGTVFRNTGVGHRYSCVPTDWYINSPGWEKSNEIYLENSLDLLEQCAKKAFLEAGITPQEIDSIVCVSSTGLAIPSLEARLANRMNINPEAKRVPIFGLGCAGGTSGLSLATRIAQTIDAGNVLLLVVELAGLNVHVNQESPALFVSTALFGDGAAAVILRNTNTVSDDKHKDTSNMKPQVLATGEYQWRDTEDVMGWVVKDDGLDVVLSNALPKFTTQQLRPAIERFLEQNNVKLSDVRGYVFHPGGRKILEAVRETLGLADEDLRHSWDVLNEYGNMSAPTVLFILQRTINSDQTGLHLMVSFGPAFTISFALLEL